MEAVVFQVGELFVQVGAETGGAFPDFQVFEFHVGKKLQVESGKLQVRGGGAARAWNFLLATYNSSLATVNPVFVTSPPDHFHPSDPAQYGESSHQRLRYPGRPIQCH